MGTRIASVGVEMRRDKRQLRIRLLFQSKWIQWYRPTYRTDYHNYSPGKVHIALLLEEACQNQWQGFDFLTGPEPYKLQWSNETMRVLDYYASFSSKSPAFQWFTQGKPYVRDRLGPMYAQMQARQKESPVVASTGSSVANHVAKLSASGKRLTFAIFIFAACTSKLLLRTTTEHLDLRMQALASITDFYSTAVTRDPDYRPIRQVNIWSLRHIRTTRSSAVVAL